MRPVRRDEIDKVADFISTGYYHDEFFIWSVKDDDVRHRIVADYYKIYLGAAGCVAYVAENPEMGMIGAAVWLPHDTDASIYEDIDCVTGKYSPQFRAVADRSHNSEPPIGPFYQLVGFVTHHKVRGMGMGAALLKHHLDTLDEKGIPTYLEASTPYFGGGVYGRFGYKPVGELMVFADTAVLYPLWRPALGLPAMKKERHDFGKGLAPDSRIVRFGNYDWRVLDVCNGKTLLLSENIAETGTYHDSFESVAWAESDIRKHLNSHFYNTFTQEEQLQIVETQVCTPSNPWFGTDGGGDTADKIFLLSVNEAVKYLGGTGQPGGPDDFYVDDEFNNARRARCINGSPSRWMLRTPGILSYMAVTVTINGRVAITGDFVNRASTELFSVGIRPALWVDFVF